MMDKQACLLSSSGSRSDWRNEDKNVERRVKRSLKRSVALLFMAARASSRSLSEIQNFSPLSRPINVQFLVLVTDSKD